VFIEAKDDGGGVDNWTTGAISHKSCKAPVKSSPPTNQHPSFFYRPDALPVTQRYDWNFAGLIAPVVTTTPIILCFHKHRLTEVHLENGHKMDTKRD